MITRVEILEYVKEKYNTKADYPFENDFDSAVLRHTKGKWYGLIMHVRNKSLNIEDVGETEIINLKIDPELNHFLKGQAGVLPAYHMNKEHWISIILNSSFDKEELLSLIDMSYLLTENKKISKKIC